MNPITETQIAKAVREDSADVALKSLMDIAGIKTGDVAGMLEWAGWPRWSLNQRTVMVRKWMAFERVHTQKTQADYLQDAIEAIWNGRSGGCLDGLSIADIRTVARLIDSDVREETYIEHYEHFRSFVFPDASSTAYTEDEDSEEFIALPNQAAWLDFYKANADAINEIGVFEAYLLARDSKLVLGGGAAPTFRVGFVD